MVSYFRLDFKCHYFLTNLVLYCLNQKVEDDDDAEDEDRCVDTFDPGVSGACRTRSRSCVDLGSHWEERAHSSGGVLHWANWTCWRC